MTSMKPSSTLTFTVPLPCTGAALSRQAALQQQPRLRLRRIVQVPCTKYAHCQNARPMTKMAMADGRSPLVLSEESVETALEEVKSELGSVFGNSEENRNVGITGDVQLASLDGPVVVLRFTGRFWHKRADVFARVSAYLQSRIPEICDTEVESEEQLRDDDTQE